MRLPIREDIRLHLAAQAAGWRTTWPSHGDPVAFYLQTQGKSVAVWSAKDGWQAKDFDHEQNCYRGDRRVYGFGFDALKRALETEGGCGLTIQVFTDEQKEKLAQDGWEVAAEGDYADYRPQPGGDNAAFLMARGDGFWALCKHSTQQEVHVCRDPLRLTAPAKIAVGEGNMTFQQLNNLMDWQLRRIGFDPAKDLLDQARMMSDQQLIDRFIDPASVTQAALERESAGPRL